MKKLSKVLVLVLSAIMVLAMSASVFAAAGDYTITVNGAAKDGVYTAYKIFDATTTAGGDIAYTVEKGSALETLLRGETSAAKTAFLEVFNITDNGGKIYVTQKAAADKVVEWMNANAETYKIGTPTTVTNTAGDATVVLDVGASGYYFVKSDISGDAAVMLTSTNPKAVINDKHETTPTIPTDAKKVKVNGKLVDVSTLDLGTKVEFDITINAVNYVTTNGESQIVYEYNVEDTPNGFAIDADSVKVAISDGTYAGTITKSVDTNGKLTVKIPWADGDGSAASPYTAKYATPNVITVSYDATLTKVTAANNKATIGYNGGTNIGDDEVPVYNYTVDVDKVDAKNTSTKLPGAEFALKNADGKYYKYTAATDTTAAKVEWVDKLADATTKWTSADGTQAGTTYQQVVFEGIAAGNGYKLVEVTAPVGYNLAADTTFDLPAVTTKLENTSSLTVPFTVQDEAGSTLPATGGIGTTIFYVLGSLLVIGCGIVLVSRRRMENHK